MTTNKKVWTGVLMLAAAAALAGCGGGGDEATAVEDSAGKVPSSATSSVSAFVNFVGDQAPTDHAEPLSLNGTVPPTSDSEEPMSVT